MSERSFCQAEAEFVVDDMRNSNYNVCGASFLGEPAPANSLGEGDRARFFIFDCDQVVRKPKPASVVGDCPKCLGKGGFDTCLCLFVCVFAVTLINFAFNYYYPWILSPLFSSPTNVVVVSIR